MYAIIKTGGKQYKVAVDDVFLIEKLTEDKGKKILFDQVLLVKNDDKIEIGKPFLKDWVVQATLEDQIKDKKIDVVKFRSKSRYRRKMGHRQPMSKIKITDIKKISKKASKNGKN